LSKKTLSIISENPSLFQKLFTNLKGLGYTIENLHPDEQSIVKLQKNHRDIILWTTGMKEESLILIRKLRQQVDEMQTAVYMLFTDHPPSLDDRLEATKAGVDDIISVRDDLNELKSKILLRETDYSKSRKYANNLRRLVDTNYNLMISQGVENLCELAADYILTAYRPVLLVFSISGRQPNDFDYFNVFSSEDNTPNLREKMELSPLWRQYLLHDENLAGRDVTSTPLLQSLPKFGIRASRLSQFALQYKDNMLGVLILGMDELLDGEEETSLLAFSQALSHRITEVRRFYGLQKYGGKKESEFENYFERPNEDEILRQLSHQLMRVLAADLCIYMNYHEGFRFLSPKYLFIGERKVNLIDKEKPPVLMLNDFPTLEKMIGHRNVKIIDLLEGKFAEEFSQLPGLDTRQMKNMVIFQLQVGAQIQGYFVLGRGSIIKKFLNKEIDDSEKLILSATRALEEDRILKQAKLTIKQLERIFELGTELTLDVTLENILKKICGAIRRTLGWNIVILDIKNPYDENYKTVGLLGLKDADYQSLIKGDNYPIFHSRLGKSIQIGNSFFYDHARVNDETRTEQDALRGEWNDNDWIYVPIMSRGKQLGMISLNDPVERRRPSIERIRSIEYFANQAAVVIENTELYEKLKSSELRYRMLAETMTMGLVTCNMSGKIIYVNTSLARMLKYEDIEHLLTKKFYDFCNENSRSKLEKTILSILTTKGDVKAQADEVSGIEIELIAADDEVIPFMMYSSPFYQQNEKIGFFGVLSDLRNQKKIERMRSDFNSMIVHDLRSPLNIIQGYVDIVRTEVVGPVNEEQVELLTIAKENVYKLLKLIDNFLIASKLEAGHLEIEPETNSLNNLMETIFDHYQVLAKEKNIKLEKKLDENIPYLSFDKFRMEQVMRNYLSNALKFTPPDGKITISSKLRREERENGEMQMFVDASVTDTGVGISEAELNKVFNKYAQTEAGKDAQLKGTGLGLAICREIVELHKGEVWVKSKLHEGSTFGFTLPINSLEL
jgi:PAS domain S-box-containing protein